MRKDAEEIGCRTRGMQEDEKERLVGNIASHLVNAQEFIQVQETTETRGRDVIIE